jgi:hypothetical protein
MDTTAQIQRSAGPHWPQQLALTLTSRGSLRIQCRDRTWLLNNLGLVFPDEWCDASDDR